MTTYLDADRVLIERTARKPHRCEVHRHASRPNAYEPRVCHKADGMIQPGERYVEYIGEVPCYQTGDPYCRDCARDVWGV